jgi:inner membrane protein
MFLFGHIGITLGAAVAVTGVISTCRGSMARRRLQTQPAAACDRAQNLGGLTGSDVSAFSPAAWVESLGKFLDLRLLVLGALLPDIIDKPLGMFLFGDGRTVAHSLIVTLLVLLTGVFLNINYRRTAVLAVACGMAAHLILDSIWASPAVFLWPLYGWAFPAGERTSYLSVWLTTLTTVPSAYLSEGIGLLIMVALAGVVARKKKLLTLFVTGRF